MRFEQGHVGHVGALCVKFQRSIDDLHQGYLSISRLLQVLTVYFCSVEHFQQFECVISCCLTLSNQLTNFETFSNQIRLADAIGYHGDGPFVCMKPCLLIG